MDIQQNLSAYLERLNIRELNPMQKAALEATTQHDELMLLSNTGSGKTLAFLLSMLSHIDENSPHTQALIMVPSRELALQIDEVFRKLGTQLKVTLCYGGHKREIEEQNLVQAPVIIIGTAGRLADHIRRRNIETETIRTLILDEYDKSMELGFHEEMEFIISSLSALEKKILTSATASGTLPDFFKVNNPHQLNYIMEGGEASNAALEMLTLFSPEKDKINTLFNFLCYANNRPCIVFCNHRDAVERVAQLVADKGIRTTFYHGGMEQRERESELCMFKNSTSNVLVTTDLASRGLDIAGIRYIIHYHPPAGEEVFTHRNGRTARMNDFGTAILLITEEEKLPEFIDESIKPMDIPAINELPAKTQWNTLHISLGKKDKVNKIDIVGFLSQVAGLKKDDIGLIEVKDFYAFAAIRKNKVSETLRLIKDHRLKGKKVKIDVALAMVSSK